MRWDRMVGLAALGAAALSGNAAAAPTDSEICTITMSASDVDVASYARRIAACTSLLKSATTPEQRVPLLLARADAYGHSGNALRSLIDVETLERLGGFPGSVAYERAVDYSLLNYNALSLDQIERAIRSGLEGPSVQHLRGVAKAYLGRYGEAIEDLDLAILGTPTAAGAYEARGLAELEIGEADRAVKDLDLAIKLAPTEAQAYYLRGRAHFVLDALDAAIADFRKAQRLNPDLTVAGEEVEDIQALQNAPSTTTLANRSDQYSPSRAVGHSHHCGGYYPILSELLLETGDVLIRYDVSETGAISGVGVMRSSGNERLDRAAVYCVSQRWRNTPAYNNGVPMATPHEANIVFQLHPGKVPNRILGETLAGLGRYDEALTEFTRIIGLDPANGAAYYDRAVLEIVRQDYASAGRDLDLAAKNGSDDDKTRDARDLLKVLVLPKTGSHDGI